MPTFQFKCLPCDITFEFFKIRSDEKAACPQCESQDNLMQMFVGNSGFILNGGGWFKDGYTKPGRGNGSKQD